MKDIFSGRNKYNAIFFTFFVYLCCVFFQYYFDLEKSNIVNGSFIDIIEGSKFFIMVNKSDFEDLPDEILIEICYYLNTFDIIYSFGRLNRRFQCAISEFRCKFDFSSFSLNEFQRLYSPYLLNLICSRVIKLSLSNECCPGQIKLFENLINDKSFKEKLPLLKCLTLIEFTNDNITILSKILYIEELNLEFSSYEKITNENENIFIYYIFNTLNYFEKVNLNTNYGLKMKSAMN